MKPVFGQALAAIALMAAVSSVQASTAVSMPVPGAADASGRKVLTFIAKDPPGVRCNGNLQVAAELANTYQVPIQLLPSSLAPHLPAPAVFYGNELIAADGNNHNGAVTFQIVSDVMDVEGVPKHAREGLLFNANVRRNFDGLKSSIKSGGK